MDPENEMDEFDEDAFPSENSINISEEGVEQDDEA